MIFVLLLLSELSHNHINSVQNEKCFFYPKVRSCYIVITVLLLLMIEMSLLMSGLEFNLGPFGHDSESGDCISISDSDTSSFHTFMNYYPTQCRFYI